MYALIDCNNFYVSCERVFEPRLQKMPVCVLSNNDGCIISRSNEIKKMGIPMAAPFHAYKAQLKRRGAAVFSSNYALYADISKRVMAIIQQETPTCEIYSIDEAFVYFPQLDDYQSFCQTLKDKIQQWVGIPVSIGIAPTKTLAKAANYLAKKDAHKGVYQCTTAEIDEMLKKVPLQDIWGIGRNMLKKFQALNIMTPLELKNYCPFLIREKFGIVYQKLIFELNGQSRLLLEDSKPKKNIVSSRSFSHAISDLPTLSQAICYFVSIAAAKARAQHSKATGLSLYIRTDRFNHEIEQYSQGVEINLEIPTNDTIHLNRAAKKLLKQIYRPGYNYKKAEVCLKGLIDEKFEQYVLFEEGIHSPHEKLMELMDSVNYKMGKQTLFFAAEGIKKNWITRSRGRSKRYTTRWDELKEVS